MTTTPIDPLTAPHEPAEHHEAGRLMARYLVPYVVNGPGRRVEGRSISVGPDVPDEATILRWESEAIASVQANGLIGPGRVVASVLGFFRLTDDETGS